MNSLLALALILPAAADTYVRQGAPNQNQGGESTLRIRQSGKNRALVRFDAGAVTAAVGGRDLVTAHLEVDVAANGENWGGGRTVDLHRLTQAWTEDGATWNSADGATAWAMDGAAPRPWDAAPTATLVVTSQTAGTLSFDVTADVAAILDGGDAHGWILKKTDPGWC
jgi:hypothetical protein